MDAVVHLDTHVAMWLFAGDRRRLKPVWKTLDRSDLVLSPMALVELQFLYEIGRAKVPATEVVADLVERVGLRVSDAPFAKVALSAVDQSWTRDPFDRLIVANAAVERKRLVTSDETVLAHYPRAIWR
ncbi:MAG: PIN domain-containing protein [Deltaproteobacteria bacterium]|nr:PIN domain-containing protein [Deltaproteobacteria bacterium]